MTGPEVLRPDGVTCWALFDATRRYRYSLFRDFTPRPSRRLNVIALNPSTATETTDDPTIRRCMGFARDWGYDGLVVTNLFAFRATDPAEMRAAANPAGPDNDHWLTVEASKAALVVAAWGVHGKHLSRGACVTRMLLDAGIALHCFGLTAEGYPKHPLYLARTTLPMPMEVPGATA